MPVAGSLMGFAAGDARGGTHGMRGVVSVLVWLCPSGCAPVSATAHCGRYGGAATSCGQVVAELHKATSATWLKCSG